MLAVKRASIVAKKSFFFVVSQGVAIGLLLSVAAVLGLTGVVFFTEFPLVAANLNLLLVGIMVLSVFSAALLEACRYKAKGLLLGFLIGGLYAGLVLACGEMVLPEPGEFPFYAGKFSVCALAGALGGVIGVNVNQS